MHKNFIFDCGNVFRSWDLYELGLKFFNKEDMEQYLPVLHKDWALLDGGMSEDEYFNKYKGLIPERLYPNFHNLLYHWVDYFTPINEMIEIIKTLKKQGKKIYVLSNMPPLFVKNFDMFDELKEFDGLVFSCEIKMTKPNKEIYDYILQKYNLNPDDCIFIDDLKDNIIGAKNASIDGFIFDKHNINDFKEFLRKTENIAI